jgi:hypothetical protein
MNRNLSLLVAAVVLLLAVVQGDALAQNSLVIQSYDGHSVPQAAPVTPPPPRVVATPANPATRGGSPNTLIDYYQGYKDKPTQGGPSEEEEYRGYNGKTLVQAYLGCKYEAYRAATPGDRGKGVMEKMRIRIYVMDACMNREGFFRNRALPMMDLSLVTSADIFRGF